MGPLPRPRFTPGQYLDYDRHSAEKHEYYYGDIFAMAGGTAAPARIAVNTTTAFRNILPPECGVFSSDLRVCIQTETMFTYPDATIVCGEARFLDRQSDTLTNPTLIVEVLSPSTADYDMGPKAAAYRTIASLTDLLLIAQDTVNVQHWQRLPNGHWSMDTTTDAAGVIRSRSLACEIRVADVYRGALA